MGPKFRNKDLGYGDVRIGLNHKREMSLGGRGSDHITILLGEEGAIIDLSGGSYHRNCCYCKTGLCALFIFSLYLDLFSCFLCFVVCFVFFL
jgi:hypothetical protein